MGGAGAEVVAGDVFTALTVHDVAVGGGVLLGGADGDDDGLAVRVCDCVGVLVATTERECDRVAEAVLETEPVLVGESVVEAVQRKRRQASKSHSRKEARADAANRMTSDTGMCEGSHTLAGCLDPLMGDAPDASRGQKTS